MAHWLFKSEPDAWSWDQQKAKGAKGEPWSGVRNFTAANNMKAMKKGDRGFFYHSGEERSIVGIVEVIGEYRPDPTDEKGRPARGHGLGLGVEADRIRPVLVEVAEAGALPAAEGVIGDGTGIGTLTPTMPTLTRLAKSRAASPSRVKIATPLPYSWSLAAAPPRNPWRARPRAPGRRSLPCRCACRA
jgi:hypothetical protein